MLNAQTQISKEIVYFVALENEEYCKYRISLLQERCYSAKNLTFIELEHYMKAICAHQYVAEYNAAYNTIDIINRLTDSTVGYFNLLVTPKVKVLPTVAEVKAMSIETQVELISTMYPEMAEIERNSSIFDRQPDDAVKFMLKYGFDSTNKTVVNAAYKVLSDILPF